MQSTQAVQKYVSTRFLATRRGTIVLGLAAAVLAALVLFVYLNQYRDSVGAGSAPVSVLVARSLIEVGTPGDAIAAQGRTELVQTSEDSVLPGAYASPQNLIGLVTIARVFPGQQLTTADFQAVGVSGVGAQLVKNQRAVAVPVDAEHGLIGRLVAGDKVDIYGEFSGVLKLMMQNILVLEPPVASGSGVSGGGGSSNVLVRVVPRQASHLAFAADNGKLWFVLRPRTGSRRVVPNTVTLDKVLAQGR